MRREELCQELRAPFTKERGYGVAKTKDPAFANIWFVVPPPPPAVLPRDLPVAAVRRANRALNSLKSFGDMDEVDRTVNYLFVRREALQSSRMEGTWSTIDHVLTPRDAYVAKRGKDEHQSIRGYAAALEKLSARTLREQEGIFTEKTVCQIHREIMAKDPAFRGFPGVLRAPKQAGSVVFIGGQLRPESSIYNPAPPERVKICLASVLEWLRDADLAQAGDAGVGGFSLPVRLAISHACFEAVHPFNNGNGRVGRALWPLQMICAGHMPVYLSGFVEMERDTYGRALQAAQKQLKFGPIVEFIAEAIELSAKEASITKAAALGLVGRWRERAKFRAKSASERALDVLLKQPIMTAALLVRELKISKQAASVAIQQLVERGVIAEREKAGKTHVYAAEELIALLSREFGADAELAMQSGRAKLTGLG